MRGYYYPALFTIPPTATPPVPASGAFRSVAHPHRTGEYASGALGRKTPHLRDLTASRYGRMVYKAGLWSFGPIRILLTVSLLSRHSELRTRLPARRASVGIAGLCQMSATPRADASVAPSGLDCQWLWRRLSRPARCLM